MVGVMGAHIFSSPIEALSLLWDLGSYLLCWPNPAGDCCYPRIYSVYLTEPSALYCRKPTAEAVGYLICDNFTYFLLLHPRHFLFGSSLWRGFRLDRFGTVFLDIVELFAGLLVLANRHLH